MVLKDKINFRQPKYMLPAIVYFPLLFCGYFLIELFSTEKAETSTMETTEYYNDKLPDANIKGDGIGDKYTNMLNDFGKIKDESAVENIERNNEKITEDYESQYTDAEVAAMDQSSQTAQESMEKLRKMQEEIKKQQAIDDRLSDNDDRHDGNTPEEDETLESLRQALDEARHAGQNHLAGTEDMPKEVQDAVSEAEAKARKKKTEPATEPNVVANEKAVVEISEETHAEQVVKEQKETSDYFNTIEAKDSESKLIKAIVDEDVTAVDGSRVRLRLLDDIDIGERSISKGTYLYCLMSGFGQQRVKGTVKSVLVDDELVKVNLSIYDTDGMEGLYVPKSSFRETTNSIASSALSQSMNVNDGSATGTFSKWGMQALQNAIQKSTNAISKNIRKNKAKIKYGTQVYLVNSKEKRQQTGKS